LVYELQAVSFRARQRAAHRERAAVEIEIALFEAEQFGPCHVTRGCNFPP
jgi:hypothetical protein